MGTFHVQGMGLYYLITNIKWEFPFYGGQRIRVGLGSHSTILALNTHSQTSLSLKFLIHDILELWCFVTWWCSWHLTVSEAAVILHIDTSTCSNVCRPCHHSKLSLPCRAAVVGKFPLSFDGNLSIWRWIRWRKGSKMDRMCGMEVSSHTILWLASEVLMCL